jgi:hypothetical protein
MSISYRYLVLHSILCVAFENGHIYYYDGRLEGERILWQELLKHHQMKLIQTNESLGVMKICPESPSLIGIGGKEIDLQIWDIHRSTQESIFKAKNVRPRLESRSNPDKFG